MAFLPLGFLRCSCLRRGGRSSPYSGATARDFHPIPYSPRLKYGRAPGRFLLERTGSKMPPLISGRTLSQVEGKSKRQTKEGKKVSVKRQKSFNQICRSDLRLHSFFDLFTFAFSFIVRVE
jgi:hypothetical protein